jgi:L-threonylcarbamoyladenylate synthase
VLLRPGHISAEQIAAVIGQLPGLPDQSAPRASGTLESHYAPHTPVAMLAPEQLPATLARLEGLGRKVALIAYSTTAGAGPRLRLPDEPVGYAYGLYAALRQLDQSGADLILVEAPPHELRWLGVNDRLRRAAFGSSGIVERFLRA